MNSSVEIGLRDRVALVASGLTAAFHLVFANRYGLFRDELYFIVCGRHPALGYADQPPLVPLIAAGAYALGAQTWIVRLPAVLAAAALVWVVVEFVRLLGGGSCAAWTAAIAAAAAPVLMGLTATLNTTTLEPLAWTLVAYGVARAVLRHDRHAPLWAGLAAGLAMEAKYALPLWLIAIATGLLLGRERAVFSRRELWTGIGIATIVALPSVVWQSVHGWPFVELVRNAGDKDGTVAPLSFALNQIFILNPLLAPLWIGGLVAPFALRDLRGVRFLPIAFGLTVAVIVTGGGKDYYLAPAYPALFAVGSVVFERFVASVAVRSAYLAAAIVVSIVVSPLALPILAPQTLLAYERALRIAPQQQERGDVGNAFPATFADMLGWRDFVRQVGTAYERLPPADRAKTAVLVDNYGEAAALDIFGAPYHLPPSLAGHNQYFFWGSRGQNVRNLLRVQNHPERLAPHCREMRVVGTTASPYARAFENGKSIVFCRGLHPSLETTWPTLKLFA